MHYQLQQEQLKNLYQSMIYHNPMHFLMNESQLPNQIQMVHSEVRMGNQMVQLPHSGSNLVPAVSSQVNVVEQEPTVKIEYQDQSYSIRMIKKQRAQKNLPESLSTLLFRCLQKVRNDKLIKNLKVIFKKKTTKKITFMVPLAIIRVFLNEHQQRQAYRVIERNFAAKLEWLRGQDYGMNGEGHSKKGQILEGQYGPAIFSYLEGRLQEIISKLFSNCSKVTSQRGNLMRNSGQKLKEIQEELITLKMQGVPVVKKRRNER